MWGDFAGHRGDVNPQPTNWRISADLICGDTDFHVKSRTCKRKAAVEEKTVDLGDDGIPDKGGTADIVSWLKDKGVQTRAGLTKAQLLTKVEEQLNPTDESDEATGSDE